MDLDLDFIDDDPFGLEGGGESEESKAKSKGKATKDATKDAKAKEK
jgi:hypothetical protein